MSATIVGERRQITLPAEVCEPAHIDVGDQIDWRFEGNEIRGRKLAPPTSRRDTAKLTRDGKTGLLYFDTDTTYEEMESAALNANLDRGQ
jgi:hypothetical protein